MILSFSRGGYQKFTSWISEFALLDMLLKGEKSPRSYIYLYTCINSLFYLFFESYKLIFGYPEPRSSSQPINISAVSSRSEPNSGLPSNVQRRCVSKVQATIIKILGLSVYFCLKSSYKNV